MSAARALGAFGSFAATLALAGCLASTPPRAERSAALRPQASEARQGDAGRAQRLSVPNAKESLKFAVLGDFGTGDRRQRELAERMALVHDAFPFEFVVLVGDNIYGAERPQDMKRKFEEPYRTLLDAGVEFYASLGNHDAREQRFYKLFNMGGRLYYSFKAPKQDVRFYALESTYMEPEQRAWIEQELASTREDWKIVFQHHPLYSSGGRHGSDRQLREALEPVFVEHGVDVVLAGHDHIYERTKPQHGIVHFVAGSGGKLRRGDARRQQPFSAAVEDETNVFLVIEILDDRLSFNAIAADGRIVDAGEFERSEVAATGQTMAKGAPK